MNLIILLAILESLFFTVLGFISLPVPYRDFLPSMYTGFAGFTNTFLICFVINILLVYPFYKFKKVKTSFASALIVLLVLSILAVTDFKVYAIYRFHLNKAMLDLFINGGGDVIAFSDTMWLSITGYCLGLLLCSLTIIITAYKFHDRIITGRKTAIISTIIVLFILCNLVHAYSKARGIPSVYRNSEVITLYYPLTANKLLGGTNTYIPDETGNAISYPLHPLTYAADKNDGKKLNIYMIFVDSLRADMLNSDNMPYLTEIAKNNLKFTHHLSGGNATRNGVFTLFYGLPGSYWNRILNSNVQSSLITGLQEQGYKINAFAGAQLYKPEFNKTVFSKVKDLRIESHGNNVSEKDLNAISDFKKFVTDNQGSPKFAFVFLDKLHSMELTPEEQKNKKFPTPWNSPDYLAIDKNFDRNIIFNLYKNVVFEMDKQIKDITDFLKEQGEWDNSVIIISSDHGNEFDDNGHGYYGHNSNFTDAQIHIPLVVHWPEKEPREYNYTTTSYDITATLMPDVLGVTNDTADYTIGKSLFDGSERDIIISSSYLEDAIIKKDHIIISSSINGLSIKTKNFSDSENSLSAEDKKDIERKLEIDRTYVHHD